MGWEGMVPSSLNSFRILKEDLYKDGDNRPLTAFLLTKGLLSFEDTVS